MTDYGPEIKPFRSCSVLPIISAEGYVSQTAFRSDLPLATIIATAELQWTLGGTPNYFGQRVEITDERESFLDMPAPLRMSKSARYFAVVDATGIGPTEPDEKWLAHTSFTFNSQAYDLAKYLPYRGRSDARRYTARFVIPLQTPPVLGSRNAFSFRAGRYALEDGSVALDNFIIRGLSIAVVN